MSARKAKPDLEVELRVAKARLDEATEWHQYNTQHDDDSWCCKRESELRDDVMALEAALPSKEPR